MEEFEIKRSVSREELQKEGKNAARCLIGAVYLMVLTIGARFIFLGITLSGFALFMGLRFIFSKDREEIKPALIMIAAGTLGILFRFGPGLVRAFSAFLLGLGAMGLFVAGIWKGVNFLIGLKNRQ